MRARAKVAEGEPRERERERQGGVGVEVGGWGGRAREREGGSVIQRRSAHRAREREHEQMLVERSVLEPSLAQPGGKVGLRVPRHIAFAMLFEQLFLALRLDGLPVDLYTGRGLAGL